MHGAYNVKPFSYHITHILFNTTQNIFCSCIGIDYTLTDITHNCVCQTNVTDIWTLLEFYAGKIPEERRSHLHRGGSLKSRTNVVIQSIFTKVLTEKNVNFRHEIPCCNYYYYYYYYYYWWGWTAMEMNHFYKIFENMHFSHFFEIPVKHFTTQNYQKMTFNLKFSHYPCVCHAHLPFCTAHRSSLSAQGTWPYNQVQCLSIQQTCPKNFNKNWYGG